MKPTLTIYFLIGAALVLALPVVALGQQPAPDVSTYFDTFRSFQQEYAELWRARAYIVSTTIFGALVTLQLVFYCWRYMFGGMRDGEIGSLKRRAWVTVIIYLTLTGIYFLDGLVFGMRDIALYVTGQERPVSEMGLLSEGIGNIFTTLSPNDNDGVLATIAGSLLSFVTGGFFYLIAALGVFFGYAIMALQYAFITIEIFITLAIGPVPVALGGLYISEGTAESYIEHLVYLGFKVLCFYLVFGVARAMLDALAADIDQMTVLYGWGPLLELSFVAILSVFILAKLPDKLASAFTKKLDIKFAKLF